MRRIGSTLLIGIGAGVLALPVHADEVYSWKDRGGTVHYSNVPVPVGVGPSTGPVQLVD